MNFNRLPVSVIVLTYNEEANIADCLQSLVDWAGEIFLVDSGSTDRTLDIARRYTNKIVEHPFENYAQQRNWAQDHLPLSYEWVCHIDADERVTTELVRSFQRFFVSDAYTRVDALLICRRVVFLGKSIFHGGVYPVYHLRLFRWQKGRCENRLYDQHFVVSGISKKMNGDLLCFVTTDLTDWTYRHVRWATLEAQEQLSVPDRVRDSNQVIGRMRGTPIERRRWLRNDVYNRAPLFFRAFAYFFYRYIVRLGFLDGAEGLIFHFLQGCWYRFYIDVKMYEASQSQMLASTQTEVTVPDLTTDKQ